MVLKLYSGVLENFQWEVSKTDIQISPPAFMWKVVKMVTVFVIAPVVINALIGFKEVTQVGYWILIYKPHIRLLLLLVL